MAILGGMADSRGLYLRVMLFLWSALGAHRGRWLPASQGLRECLDLILDRDDQPTSPIVRGRRAQLFCHMFHVPKLCDGNVPPTIPRVSSVIPNSRGT